MTYTPRLTAPSITDKNYINVDKGGKNKAIKISSITGSVLPNCVGYCWGRWLEILGEAPKLSINGARRWYDIDKNDGYKRGDKPKLGAVACWNWDENFQEQGGHVAIVERINDDGTMLLSQSNYGGKRFETVTKKIGADITYTLKGKSVRKPFQGFIYLPIEFTNKKKVVNTLDNFPLKDRPSKSGKTLANMTFYKTVEVIEENYTYADGYKWDKIVYNGITGYATNYLLSDISNAEKKVTPSVGLRIRQTPSTKAVQIGFIPCGGKVKILVEGVTKREGYTWDYIEYANIKGYVANKYLK